MRYFHLFDKCLKKKSIVLFVYYLIRTYHKFTSHFCFSISPVFVASHHLFTSILFHQCTIELYHYLFWYQITISPLYYFNISSLHHCNVYCAMTSPFNHYTISELNNITILPFRHFTIAPWHHKTIEKFNDCLEIRFIIDNG